MPADIDANTRVYLCDERILTYRSMGVALCRMQRSKKVDFFLSKWSLISPLNYKYHYPHYFLQLYCTYYVERLCKIKL